MPVGEPVALKRKGDGSDPRLRGIGRPGLGRVDPVTQIDEPRREGFAIVGHLPGRMEMMGAANAMRIDRHLGGTDIPLSRPGHPRGW